MPVESNRSPGCRSASTVTNGKRQLVGIARADRDRAHAAAVRLHRDRMLGIADQDHFGRAGIHLGHLSEDAFAVEHGLALEHAVDRPLVEQHAMAERVEVDIQDRSHEHLFRRRLPVFARISRSRRFSSSSAANRCNCRLARRRRAVSSRFSWRRLPAIGERTGDPAPGAERKIDDPLHGMHDRTEPLAHLVDLVIALVGDHQPDRDRREHDERRN